MKKKLSIIFLVYYFLIIITACGDCQNYDTEITNITFVPINTFISLNSNLEFDIVTEETVIAQLTKFDLKLIQSAYATGCDDTYNPVKWINNVNVTSNQDFSPDYLSGNSLNDLISVEYFKGSEMSNINASLNEYIEYINLIGDGGKSNFNFETFTIHQRPELNQLLSLQFEFIFTDGSNFILGTEQIEWE
ncbi:hypothetical protein [Winogradskyella forsetii]|uniref:hypothetical protein n=1 Tax=Winogradskyella forsetii TaxID=2686077 RepID=UPI0015BF19E0|nr:hypothetical protein [Winogradskyella forsetii]